MDNQNSNASFLSVSAGSKYGRTTVLYGFVDGLLEHLESIEAGDSSLTGTGQAFDFSGMTLKTMVEKINAINTENALRYPENDGSHAANFHISGAFLTKNWYTIGYEAGKNAAPGSPFDAKASEMSTPWGLVWYESGWIAGQEQAHELGVNFAPMTPVLVKDLYDLKFGQKETIDCGTFTITVMRRQSSFRRTNDDWWACLNGHEGVWCCGASLDYVIGYTILTMIGWQQTLAHRNYPDLKENQIDELHQTAREILTLKGD